MTPEELTQSAQRASELLKVLCNEHRLLVLCYLAEGEKSVGELEKLVGLGQSALSQHLARLRRDNLVKTRELEKLVGLGQSALSQHLARLRRDKLVKTRRAGLSIFYSLASPEVIAVIETLHRLYCETPDDRTEGVESPPSLAEVEL